MTTFCGVRLSVENCVSEVVCERKAARISPDGIMIRIMLSSYGRKTSRFFISAFVLILIDQFYWFSDSEIIP